MNRGSLIKRRLLVMVTLAGATTMLLWYIGVIGGNVREVVKNRVFRSAQLTGHDLDKVLIGDHIRTDINLRGGSLHDPWYRSEVSSCQRLKVAHIDVPVNGRSLPSPIQLDNLLETFDHVQYPVLFHCKAGSDRSGLVGALYLNIYQHVPLQQAETEQLTWRYGHISWGETHAMNDFFQIYEKTSGGLDLRTWIRSRYPLIYSHWTKPGLPRGLPKKEAGIQQLKVRTC